MKLSFLIYFLWQAVQVPVVNGYCINSALMNCEIFDGMPNDYLMNLGLNRMTIDFHLIYVNCVVAI